MAPASTSSRDVRAVRRLKLFNGHLNTPRILSETGPHEVSLLTAKHARCGAEPLMPDVQVEIFKVVRRAEQYVQLQAAMCATRAAATLTSSARRRTTE